MQLPQYSHFLLEYTPFVCSGHLLHIYMYIPSSSLSASHVHVCFTMDVRTRLICTQFGPCMTDARFIGACFGEDNAVVKYHLLQCTA